MPVLFAPLVAVVLGVALAWVSRVELTRAEGPLVATRPVVVATALAFLVYAPLVGYFLVFHGDWSYFYLYPHALIPSAIDLGLVLVASALIPLALVLAAPAARQKRLAALTWFAAVPGLVACGLFAWGARRLSVSATYVQFHRGFGVVPIGGSTLGRGVLFLLLVGALAVYWSVRSLATRTPPAAAPRGASAKSASEERWP